MSIDSILLRVRVSRQAMAIAVSLVLASALVVGAAESPPGHLVGIVLDDETGKPVAGAYVGTGDFGDSGGSNRARHRAEGLFASTTTGDDGRFELNGLAFTGADSRLPAHPLIVTHPDYVPFAMDVELARGQEVEVEARLTPGSSVTVTVVDTAGERLKGPVLLRLEALDGHRFIPPGRDPHLSAFASSAWSRLVRDGRFTFSTLRSGEYAVDAIQLALRPDSNPPPGYGGPVLAVSGSRFHGRLGSIRVDAGAAADVRIRPAAQGTRMTVRLPKAPAAPTKDGRQPPWLRTFVALSPNVGLLVWDDGRLHSLEDPRLGRIQKEALVWGVAPEGDEFTIENLPPGRYSVFAGPPMLLRGTAVDLASGEAETVEIAWKDPAGEGRVQLGGMDRRVGLEDRAYRLDELCKVLTTVTRSHPELRPEEGAEDLEVSPEIGGPSVWTVIEALYVRHGLTVEEEGRDTLVIHR